MKIGIVTLGGYENHGNRLQNAALVKILRDDFGVDAQTIPNWGNVREVYQIHNLKNLLGFIKNVNVNYFIFRKRLSSFITFSDKFSHEYKPTNQSRSLQVDDKDFDKIIVGSDQVWAQWFGADELGYFLLKGVPNAKRYSYAASMGNPSYEGDCLRVFNEEISKFAGVSVREEIGSKYISKILGKNIPVVLDPTMLLTGDQWKALLSEMTDNFHGKKKYVFTYFLSRPSKKMREICDVLRDKGYSIVNFNSLRIDERKYFSMGPENFVFGVSHASAVLTDSFHASVFSILFKIPFLVDSGRLEGKMSARIDTLLENNALETRRLSSDSSINDLWNVDYDLAHSLLSKRRIESIQYIRDSIIHQ